MVTVNGFIAIDGIVCQDILGYFDSIEEAQDAIREIKYDMNQTNKHPGTVRICFMDSIFELFNNEMMICAPVTIGSHEKER